MNTFLEFEYKYNADTIKLIDFINLMTKLNFIKKLDISSWDFYFTSDIEGDFLRYRESATPELTKKIKIKETNNWQRTEIDLPLDSNRINLNIVNKFVEIEGYKENFRIYKFCSIFWFENYNAVYYIVFDKNMKELNRFIEIELDKEKIKYLQDPSGELREAEKSLETLGIFAQNRLKKSLFEIYLEKN